MSHQCFNDRNRSGQNPNGQSPNGQNPNGQNRDGRNGSGPGCAVKRIVRGLAQRFGVGRGVVIAGFVLGFVFVPVLTLLVGVAAWFWVDDPERFEARAGRVADRARSVWGHTFGASPPPVPAGAEEVVDEPVAEFPELVREFERLEARAQRMERYVSSDEYRLHREFRDIGPNGQTS